MTTKISDTTSNRVAALTPSIPDQTERSNPTNNMPGQVTGRSSRMRSRLSFNQNKSDMNLDEHEEIEEENLDEEAELFYNGIHSWINADENIKTILKHVNTEIMWHELKQHRS